MLNFTHLHVHSQYSVLDGACDLKALVRKAESLGMQGLAVTDHGNLYGAKAFTEAASRVSGFKPIIGCETYVARRSRLDKTDNLDRKGDHLILLARNLAGYHNLVKLISLSWTEGFYYKPRIDKELLKQYHEGLIVSSACLAGEIPRAILAGNTGKASAIIDEYKDIFGDDFYLELMRHKPTDPDRDHTVYERQVEAGKIIIKLSQQHKVKLIATNDVHFLDMLDAEAHDRLLCVNTGKFIDDPDRLRYTGQEWFKSQEEMHELFKDVPEALENTMEILEKVEVYSLNHDPIMPDFPLPEGYTDPDEYLKDITYDGAKRRYPELTNEIRDRIGFELSTIKRMGYPGYFLIVQDFLRAAREMGVAVGPGRGSAAGSVVAYCTRITDVDPLKYNLLFERFLNPDRVSMPDIDIDFDEDGRNRVLSWVVNKYGADKVAQVITFGTMAAKGALRDVGRVHRMPIDQVNMLSKLIPSRPGITLKAAIEEVPELKAAKLSGNKVTADTLKYAEQLEGSIRQTGLHACGIIIGRQDLTDYIPVATSKESTLLVTQFDGDYIEKVGMLKMDFLGLKTLAIINDAIFNIRLSKGIDLDIEKIPFDDPPTYELFSLAKTTGIFQFESDGMKKYLRELKPNQLEDLIAMNALYRPGPMEYIPRYINRKHGREKIEYDLPAMEKYLKDTYGITVYQEQVMLLSQELAGFTKGEADSLRKAMGKKIEEIMNKLRPKFFEGCKKNGIREETVSKIWKDWESFANYAFNKSHSTCYAYVAYRQAYLKTHYPAEFMAAVLSRNLTDLKEITLFLDECKRMGIQVLGPDVNESDLKFTVNRKGEIRFGMAGIKNVGEAAVMAITDERNKNGPFTGIFDFTRRISSHHINKRCMESLAKAGAFDCFEGLHRAQLFYKENGDETIFLETILRHSADYHLRKGSSQQSLFGEAEEVEMVELRLPDCPPWSRREQLRFEKEITGFYMSGHPLDEFKLEIEQFCTVNTSQLKSDLNPFRGKEVSFAGTIISSTHKTAKNGKLFGSFVIEDYIDFFSISLFSEDYLKYKHFMEEGQHVFIHARVEPRYDNPDQLQLRVNQVSLLAEMMEKSARILILTINLEDLSEEFVAELQQIAKNHKGKCQFRLRVVDADEGLSIDLPSRKFRVDAKQVVQAVSDFPGLGIQVTE
jgi:DNA polymerase-3 subunit alpha